MQRWPIPLTRIQSASLYAEWLHYFETTAFYGLNRLFKSFLVLTMMTLYMGTAQADRVYTISSFSPQYSATITVPESALKGQKDSPYVEGPGTIRIYRQNNKQAIITLKANPVYFELKAVNSIDLPPHEQHQVVFYDDFNFDGRKDFAIRDGNNSCYSGPSFQVFLNTDKGFQKNAELTDLAQSYCGMFTVDRKNKWLIAYGKSGCCSHTASSFSLVNGKAVMQRDESFNSSDLPEPYMVHLVSFPQRNHKDFTEYLYEPDFSDKNQQILYQLQLQGTPRRTLYLELDKATGVLDYVVIHGDDPLVVELGLRLQRFLDTPKEKREDVTAPLLSYQGDQQRLSFTLHNVRYTVVDSDNAPGIEVTQNSKTTFLAGNVASRKGRLKALLSLKVSNVQWAR